MSRDSGRWWDGWLPAAGVCCRGKLFRISSGVNRNFVGEGVVQQIQLRAEDRQNGDLGAVAPLVRGSGGNCNLVQEISVHIVTFS